MHASPSTQTLQGAARHHHPQRRYRVLIVRSTATKRSKTILIHTTRQQNQIVLRLERKYPRTLSAPPYGHPCRFAEPMLAGPARSLNSRRQRRLQYEQSRQVPVPGALGGGRSAQGARLSKPLAPAHMGGCNGNLNKCQNTLTCCCARIPVLRHSLQTKY